MMAGETMEAALRALAETRALVFWLVQQLLELLRGEGGTAAAAAAVPRGVEQAAAAADLWQPYWQQLHATSALIRMLKDGAQPDSLQPDGMADALQAVAEDVAAARQHWHAAAARRRAQLAAAWQPDEQQPGAGTPAERVQRVISSRVPAPISLLRKRGAATQRNLIGSQGCGRPWAMLFASLAELAQVLEVLQEGSEYNIALQPLLTDAGWQHLRTFATPEAIKAVLEHARQLLAELQTRARLVPRDPGAPLLMEGTCWRVEGQALRGAHCRRRPRARARPPFLLRPTPTPTPTRCLGCASCFR